MPDNPHSSLANDDDDNSDTQLSLTCQDWQVSLFFIHIFSFLIFFVLPSQLFLTTVTTLSCTVWTPVRQYLQVHPFFPSDSLSLSFFSLSSYLSLGDDYHKREVKCCRKTTTKFSVPYFTPGKSSSHCNGHYYCPVPQPSLLPWEHEDDHSQLRHLVSPCPPSLSRSVLMTRRYTRAPSQSQR